jgi:spore coat polysaccharide biosynthesis protein SpsF (cytidylyltransferase family)
MIIIQARLGSTRLPAKVMLKLPSGRSVLEEVVHNCKQTGYPTVVASDMSLFDTDFIGSEDDVWQRYVDCAKAYYFDIIVRVTSDCPLLTADIIEEAVQIYQASDYEFVYNSDENGGDGFDVEVFSLADLIRYGKDKEHVTGNLRKHAKKLRIDSPVREGCSIDTIDDYIKVYRMLK